jgi:hypothetical protein
MNRSVVAFVTSSALVCAGTAGAAGPYGSFTPPSTAPPSAGFQSNVQTATTVRVTGGQLSAAVAQGARVTVKVPAHTFTFPVQIAITEPTLPGLKSLLHGIGYPGFVVATGFGLVVSRQDGTIVNGRFKKPLTVEIRGSHLGLPGERILDVTSLKSVKTLTSKRATHEASLSILKGADVLVVNRSQPPAT